MRTISEVFSINLKRLRGSRTQADIAELADIPLRSYQNAEINGSIPQGPNLAAIAKALGVKETHLFVDMDEFRPGKITDEQAIQALSDNLRTRRSTGVPSDILDYLEHADEIDFIAIRGIMQGTANAEEKKKPRKNRA